MNPVTFSVYVVAVAGLLLWVTLKSLRLRLREPPKNYMELVAISYKTQAPLPQAVRTPPVRRQLILSSKKPAVLTNLLQMDATSLRVSTGPVKKPLVYGFFHPNADAGGGGERVLWAAVHELVTSNETAVAAIYVARKPETTQASLVAAAAERFNITFTPQQTNRIVIIALTQTWVVDPSSFPVLTLLGQAIGMAVLGYEAISNLVPDVFIDTTGLAFSYPIVSFFAKIPIISYVHYPFIQNEMISALSSRSGGPKRGLLGRVKLTIKGAYYRILAMLYRYAGSFSTVVTCNSTWTKKHLTWSKQGTIVYPPCAVQDFPPPTATTTTTTASAESGKTEGTRSPAIVYLAQFRPEKRHDLVIRSFAKFLKAYKQQPGSGFSQKPHLILIGSVRDEVDQLRVHELNALAVDLGLRDADYTIVQNAPWSAVQKILASSLIGLNAMWNEHFGMGVVEIMAAGLIPVVHASAGPLMDIVKNVDPSKPAPGFFFRSARDPDADSADKYPTLSEALTEAFKLTPAEQQTMRENAYAAAQRFSDAAFAVSWGEQIRLVTAKVPEFVRERKALKLYD